MVAPNRISSVLRLRIGLTAARTVPGEVDHGRLRWRVDDDIADLGASPGQNELQQNLTVRLRGGYDRRGELVPACPRAGLIGQVDELVKTAVGRQRPADTGLFGYGGTGLEARLKVYASV
ncbi:MAG: hypothetical protein ACRDOI_09235, partial [Trebonia sp.]